MVTASQTLQQHTLLGGKKKTAALDLKKTQKPGGIEDQGTLNQTCDQEKSSHTVGKKLFHY